MGNGGFWRFLAVFGGKWLRFWDYYGAFLYIYYTFGFYCVNITILLAAPVSHARFLSSDGFAFWRITRNESQLRVSKDRSACELTGNSRNAGKIYPEMDPNLLVCGFIVTSLTS